LHLFSFLLLSLVLGCRTIQQDISFNHNNKKNKKSLQTLFNMAETSANSRVDWPVVAGFVWACYGLASIALFLRFRIRWNQAGFFLDDYAMFLAWLSLTVLSILHTVQAETTAYLMDYDGVTLNNEHLADFYDGRIDQLARWQTGIDLTFWTTVWMVKASFLSLYHNFLKHIPYAHKSWWAAFIITILTYIACYVVRFVVLANDDQPLDVYFTTSFDVISDALIMLLPMMILPTLQLDMRKKLGTGLVFSLGFLIVGAAITRMILVVRQDPLMAYYIEDDGSTTNLEFYDPIYRTFGSTIEGNVALLVGSLPPLAAYLTKKATNKKYMDIERSANIVEQNNRHAAVLPYMPVLEPSGAAIWTRRKSTQLGSNPLRSHPVSRGELNMFAKAGRETSAMDDKEMQEPSRPPSRAYRPRGEDNNFI
jgi:hypothetical protein